ncbi:MAG TPA: chemotaxis protein CheW [Chthonomonadaceae bacterium]|nr:chemotaxis protein CheW [Chthonomonadaceae bacterium]
MVAAAEVAVREQQLVAFCLANEIYSIDIALINEIIRLQEITQIPRTSPDIEGVINLRGKIVPILDLRRRLGLPAAEPTATTRIIVVEIADCTVGLIVDSVTGVLRLPESNIEPPSELVSDLNADYIRGVGKTESALILLLDMPRVLHIQPKASL